MDKEKQITDHQSTIEVLEYLRKVLEVSYVTYEDLESGSKAKQFLVNNIAQLTKTLETLKATP